MITTGVINFNRVNYLYGLTFKTLI